MKWTESEFWRLKHLFPEPTVDFDPDLAGKCKEGLVVRDFSLFKRNDFFTFAEMYQRSAHILFENTSMAIRKIILKRKYDLQRVCKLQFSFYRIFSYFSKGFFQKVINDNQLAFETTAMQVIFLTLWNHSRKFCRLTFAETCACLCSSLILSSSSCSATLRLPKFLCFVSFLSAHSISINSKEIRLIFV